MGRELKRVALDFDWPINTTWEGYLNPHYTAVQCSECGGHGRSPFAEQLHNSWYGYVEFKPEDRGSIPFLPDNEKIMKMAKRNVESSPDYYGTGETAMAHEAIRLANLWNSSWSHHLNQDDVDALIAAGRLSDFTHTFVAGSGWTPKEPAYHPTAAEVNLWSIGFGFGHDSINQWICVKAECERFGESPVCLVCEGEGAIWPSEEAEALYEAWQSYEPPAGEGYQIWETVSEGSPISPVFSTALDLARHMSTTRWGADIDGQSADNWLAFIEGPGWAPSFVREVSEEG